MSCGCQQFVMTGDCQCGDCPVFTNAPITGTGTSGAPLGVDFSRISKEEASFIADQICCSSEGTQVLGDCLANYICNSPTIMADLTAKIDVNVDTVSYDPATSSLVLLETDGTSHSVPLTDLIDVVVSYDAGNQIIAGSDGGAFFGPDQLCATFAELTDSGTYSCNEA